MCVDDARLPISGRPWLEVCIDAGRGSWDAAFAPGLENLFKVRPAIYWEEHVVDTRLNRCVLS